MRVAVCADVHVANRRAFAGESIGGVNARCREALDVLSAAALRASTWEADLFIVAGDLFDGVRPEPQVIAATGRALRHVADRTMFIVGNHEQVSTSEHDNSLSPFSSLAGGTRVYERAQVQRWAGAWSKSMVPVCMLPFVPGNVRECFDAMVDDACGEHRPPLLVGHFGIVDEQTPPYLRDAPDALPLAQVTAACVRHGIQLAVFGHWHRHREWNTLNGPTIVQCGALVPGGWDDAGVDGYGSLILWDSDTPSAYARAVLQGPRFIDVDVNAIAFPKSHQLYARVRASQSEVAAARELIAHNVAAGVLAGGEVLLDAAEATSQARVAACRAQNASTLAEALSAYVAEMPLDEGVDRSDVLARCRAYLAR